MFSRAGVTHCGAKGKLLSTHHSVGRNTWVTAVHLYMREWREEVSLDMELSQPTIIDQTETNVRPASHVAG